MSYANILVETRDGAGLVTLNRPTALNALNQALLDELMDALAAFEADDAVGAVVVTGSAKAFAAGADIKEMQPLSFADVYGRDLFSNCDAMLRIRKPILAAVAGYALGGGCELAMMCDLIVAGEGARFGQPEITLGVMPGMGGTQRLTRAVGKAKAMDLCLTGRMMDAAEAERAGLVARVVPDAQVVPTALEMAQAIATFSRPVTMMTKETVNRAFETTLAEGLRFERRLFHSMFALEDKAEGMAAFVEKRRPAFRHR